MVVITSLLWCPGGSALTGLWEYAADSHGPRCPAAPFSCWQNVKPLLLLLRRCDAALLRHAGSKGIMITQTKLIVQSTNSATDEIPKRKLRIQLKRFYFKVKLNFL